jgi:hypothetical protein
MLYHTQKTKKGRKPTGIRNPSILYPEFNCTTSSRNIIASIVAQFGPRRDVSRDAELSTRLPLNIDGAPPRAGCGRAEVIRPALRA